MMDRKQAAKEKAAALIKQLERGVAEVLTSDRWRQWLDFQARFHRYSWGNTLLIRMQRPDATLVAGYQTWKRMGRYVRKGEKGIKILAPVRVKRINEETGEEEYRLIGFTTATVFDVSQTDGKPLPEIARTLTTASEAGEALYKALRRVITIPVAESLDTFGANGYYDQGRDRIVIRADLAPDHKAKTLVHEYVHSICHRMDAGPVPGAYMEAVAEGAAYVVCAHFGLDTSSYSFDYVASWAQDLNIVRAVMAEIQQVSCRIITEIEEVMGLAPQVPDESEVDEPVAASA